MNVHEKIPINRCKFFIIIQDSRRKNAVCYLIPKQGNKEKSLETCNFTLIFEQSHFLFRRSFVPNGKFASIHR